MAIELLNLVNSKAALMRQVLILTNADPAHADDPNAEIARIRAIIHQNSSGKIKVCCLIELIFKCYEYKLVHKKIFKLHGFRIFKKKKVYPKVLLIVFLNIRSVC